MSFRDWDWKLLGLALALSVFSLIAILSAASSVNPAIALRQAMWVLIGVSAAVVICRIPYSLWSDFAILAYFLGVALLGFVLIAGVTRLGATRWISIFGISFQPVELAKLTTVLWLARYLAGQPNPLPWRTVLISLGAVALPTVLVFSQPDLGSSTVFLVIWFAMVVIAGLSRRTVAGFVSAAAILAPMAWFVMKPYQRTRVMVFVDPYSDPLGAGYSIIQSKIAIGSGQWFGRGWFSGTQNQLSFLPERHSDFLFSVIGEEWGFLGCMAVVAVTAALLFRVLRVAEDSSHPQGRLLAVGVFAWIGYQAFINMGMVMGLVPVVGIPFPMLSYGGSSMFVLWVAIGMVAGLRAFEASAGSRRGR